MAPPLTEVADIQLQRTTHLSTTQRWKAELTCGRFSHINGQPSATSRVQDKEVRQPKTDVIPLCHATNRAEGQTHRQTYTQTHRRLWPLYISPGLRLTRNVTRAQQFHWDGRPFGHSRHGTKVGSGCCGGWVSTGSPSNTMWPGTRPIPLYQVASWSIQPFGHNCRNATLLRVGIRLRTIFIPSLVVKTFTGRVHWVIARYQLKSSK